MLCVCVRENERTGKNKSALKISFFSFSIYCPRTSIKMETLLFISDCIFRKKMRQFVLASVCMNILFFASNICTCYVRVGVSGCAVCARACVCAHVCVCSV